MILNKFWKKWANKALHRTAIPLRSIAAGELGRLPSFRYQVFMPLRLMPPTM